MFLLTRCVTWSVSFPVQSEMRIKVLGCLYILSTYSSCIYLVSILFIQHFQWWKASVIIPPPLPHVQLRTEATTTTVLLSNLPQLVLPYAMLWNPLLQLLPTCVGTGRPVCVIDTCVGSLELKSWTNKFITTQKFTLLNTLCCLFQQCFCVPLAMNYVLLIQDFLSKFCQAHIPFVLLHRTGFVKQFIQSTMSLIQHGMTLLVWNVLLLIEGTTSQCRLQIKLKN